MKSPTITQMSLGIDLQALQRLSPPLLGARCPSRSLWWLEPTRGTLTANGSTTACQEEAALPAGASAAALAVARAPAPVLGRDRRGARCVRGAPRPSLRRPPFVAIGECAVGREQDPPSGAPARARSARTASGGKGAPHT